MWSESFQSLISDGSPAQFYDQIDNSYLILGSHSAEQIAIDSSIPSETQVLVMGLGGDDTIIVSDSGHYYDGGFGDDLFLVNEGNIEFIHGGRGTDTLDYSPRGDGVSVSIRDGDIVGEGVTAQSIENIIGSDHGDTFFFRQTVSSSYIESIDAGGGSDRIYLPDAGEQLQVDLEAERILGLREIELIGFEDVVGGDGADIILGSSAANILSGGFGDDEIEGRGGNDIIMGGAGRDLLFGGDGDDSILGNEGNDVLNGGAGHDLMDGGIGNDSLLGGAGQDWLYGGEGNDSLRGGADQDTLIGDAGHDWLLGEAGNDGLYGRDGDDWLYGGGGRDLLLGEAGDDYLDGGAGTDTLYGGLGADSFVCGPGGDTIPDFALGIDRLVGSGNRTYEQAEATLGVKAMAGDYFVILPYVSLEQAQEYDTNGLLWA